MTGPLAWWRRRRFDRHVDAALRIVATDRHPSGKRVGRRPALRVVK